MSLAINVSTVTAILLADGWHEGSDLYLDSYEFMEEGIDSYPLHRGGEGGICATGFSFRTADGAHVLFGPLTSILAVREES